MKNRKPPEKPTPEFRHSPFAALKGMRSGRDTPVGNRPPASPPKAPSRQESLDDAEDLFLRAVAGARKLDQDIATPAPGPHHAPTRKPEVFEQEDAQVFLEAMQKIGTNFRQEAIPEQEFAEEDPSHRSAAGRMKQLKRGTIRIREELDLHGFLRDEALVRLGQFIRNASRHSEEAVLVITGKGINSPEGPVLRGAVADWLRTHGRSLVAEFAPAPAHLGGSGAFVVFLRK